ncbi:MAG: Holliday junction branch migration protein RuvA [Bdellovibrionales bacterium]|nr:Holliday junction branch migration protein RuvA [Bdellovibrionales bacterium]
MIGYISGRVLEVAEETAIVDVHGLGYELSCSSGTLSFLQSSETAELRVYTHVREDAIQLFGFVSLVEKQLFLSLIKVNGIGPKMAMAILSAAPYSQLIQYIEDGDVRSLTKLPKVGKRKAEQIVLSLKGQLVIDEATSDAVKSTEFPARKDIISALVNLGFKLNDVEQVVETMEPHLDMQEGVRRGLALLTANF